MSRSDLDRIQTRLKVAIQNHQMLVTKMKNDPQNSSVQEQLHDIQSQITTLSEKQKMIVQLLRKELVTKPKTETPSPTISPGPQTSISVYGNALSLQMIPVSMPAYTVQPSRPLVTLAPKPTTNNLTTTASKPDKQQLDVAKASLHCKPEVAKTAQQGNNLHNNNNKLIKSENILGTSQKTNTAPLRVPQVHGHRPSILQGAMRYSIGRTVNSPLVPVSARRGSDTDLSNYRKLSISKDATAEERKKLEFMASLDLITQETLKDLQTRRSERKRRSTANPQFSYGHFEPERKREAVTYLTRVPIEPIARKRGRPPKIRSSIEQHTSLASPHKVVYQLCPVYVCQNPPQTSHFNKTDEQIENDVHEDFCAVCRRSGELLMCDTCNLVYHLDCLEPPISNIPQGLWSCPKCQSLNKQAGTNWPGTLALVHSYITHKAAKEEEKKRLSKNINELQCEKRKLDSSATKLNENIAQHLQKKVELQNAYSTAQQSVDKLKNLIRVFQTS